jgi:hypothetical protein
MNWGRAVGRLTSLQRLTFQHVEFSTADVLHLSSLTALTTLFLAGSAAVDDTVLCALAVRLANLESLSVSDCGLASSAPLPVLATLTKLHDLVLLGDFGAALSDTSLMLLSTLTGLTELHLPTPHKLSYFGVRAFVQRMPLLDKVAFI